MGPNKTANSVDVVGHKAPDNQNQCGPDNQNQKKDGHEGRFTWRSIT